MKGAWVRSLGVAVLAGWVLFPTVVSQMVAPANYGGHGLTTGFGRGRLDLPGIVSEGAGGRIDLPNEAAILTLRLSGDGPVHLRGQGVEQTIVATATPASVRLDLSRGGRVAIDSASRIRLHEILIERVDRSWHLIGVVATLGLLAVFLATRGIGLALGAAALLVLAVFTLTGGTLSETFARVAAAKALPALVIVILVLPLALAIRLGRFRPAPGAGRLAPLAFACSFGLSAIQLMVFDQPLPLGDPGAYFEMGGRFAEAMTRLGSPLGLGPVLSDLQPYLALPATGVLYGFLQLLGGLGLIHVAQAIAMAAAVWGLVSICEAEIGPRAAKIALAISLVHPSFSILPGIVQPEPFILLAWTLAALLALRALGVGGDLRGLLGAGVLLGVGLSLHPQGLSFLLLALVLCLLPWTPSLLRSPGRLIAPLLGVLCVLLPVAAAEHFAKPLAHLLDKQYGFFAYTSSHPLGFWLYIDSDGWQGPLRIEDTTYQKELIAMRGESATSSTLADVAAFVGRHPADSFQTVFRNLHRLWHQPDNPFAVPFVLPYGLQVRLHRGLVALFALSLPALLGGRLAILALPFVMLSMTYPAYHVFNKYATPALPFIVIGASLVMDRLSQDRARLRSMVAGLVCAALGALLPAGVFAGLGMSGDLFISLVRGLLWVGLGVALWSALRAFGADLRSRALAGLIGVSVLLCSSIAASSTDTTRGAWSVTLDQPFEVSCHFPARPADLAVTPLDPAWLLVDVQADDGVPPKIEVNGQPLDSAAPMMPVFGLASVRGRRAPEAFRQMWRAQIGEEVLAAGDLTIRVTGGSGSRIFGDIRVGNEGPRLSLGNWPYLSVYRLMHEGQYRLPTTTVPAQACVSEAMSGRPGIALVRLPQSDGGRIALKATEPLTWIF